MRYGIVLTLLLAAGCRATAPVDPAEPDTTTDRWRSLVGCYRLGDGHVSLDSVAQTEMAGMDPGIRRARFAPEPARVGGYWYLNRLGEVRLSRHDGIWGRNYVLRPQGDSLVGRRYLRTDVPGARHPGEPVVLGRAACPAGLADPG